MNDLVASLLAAQVGKPIPLNASEFQPQVLPVNLMSTSPEQLFPQGRDPKAALAGLFLIAGHWDLSHQVSQDTPSREGSYWHAIAHRIEPDTWNAGYWFRRTGDHPIFPKLHSEASHFLPLGSHWDPHAFLAFCDKARINDAEKQHIASRIQRLECDLLFSWCALKQKDL